MQDDYIGLQDLDLKKALQFDELDGYHMQFGDADLVEKIVKPYLTAGAVSKTEAIGSNATAWQWEECVTCYRQTSEAHSK